MSIFKLPNNFCDELRSLVLQFWWRSNGGKRRISWIAWKKLCAPKCLGVLGFQDYRNFNLALLGKQAWRLVTDPSSLMAKVLGGKYFHGKSFMSSELGPNPSYTWRSIWEAKQVLGLGLRRRVGDGLSTYIWKDPWIPGTQTKRVISPRGDHDEDILVAELLSVDGRSWNSQKACAFFLPFEQERIMNIRWSRSNSCDIWCWDTEKDGNYSFRSAYKLLMNEFEGNAGQSNFQREKQLWNSIWKMSIWPRIKVFFW
ncbi:putative mitochondrial protein AtMg00310 [Silene latifolia]|uniref:putative mitochondrial protein AtMg00310 n=1 Tax=Silene latifolia TaxID=37657 RepID=UPI003D770DCA